MLYMLVPAIIVVLIGVIGIGYFSGRKDNNATTGTSQSPVSQASSGGTASVLSDVAWPTYVSRGPDSVKEAYQFAVLRPDVLKYIPCYCGCGQHDGHKSNEECFVANMNQGGKTIAFDQHGST